MREREKERGRTDRKERGSGDVTDGQRAGRNKDMVNKVWYNGTKFNYFIVL